MKHVALVGILNVTPDSFSDSGQFVDSEIAYKHAVKLFTDGAEIVDIGAESTNPRSIAITVEEEWSRLEPVLARLLPTYPHRISIDSYHPEIVIRAAEAFGSIFIVNDVTGMNNPHMREVVARYQLHCIISHLPARFGSNIQAAHEDPTMNDTEAVLKELLERREQLIALGLPKDYIILDPGIGFGKTAAPDVVTNRKFLSFAKLIPDSSVMIGYSRKRLLGENRFESEPNLAAGRIAIAAGANYLRVHDVAAHRALLH